MNADPERDVAGPGPAEALAGVADRVREQQSPERACARERGQGLLVLQARAQRNTPAQPGSQRNDHREAVTCVAGEPRSGDVGLGRKPKLSMIWT